MPSVVRVRAVRLLSVASIASFLVAGAWAGAACGSSGGSASTARDARADGPDAAENDASQAPDAATSDDGPTVVDEDADAAADAAPSLDATVDAPADAATDARAEPLVSIATGNGFSCAIGRDSGVQCWGIDEFGELGLGVTDPNTHASPAPTIPPLSARLEGLGLYHACANDGVQTSCWGWNNNGELGIAPSADASVTVVGGLAGTVNRLALGYAFSCAGLGGGVTCWGDPAYGELGYAPDGAVGEPPAAIPLDAGVDELTVGWRYGCVRAPSDGSVWCWGDNTMGELAQTFDGDAHPAPVRIGTLSGVRQIAIGFLTTCVVMGDETVQCWGSDEGESDGTLGGVLGHDPSTDPTCTYGACSPTPTPVAGLSHVREVAIGISHACAVLDDDTVSCWGANSYGELGHAPSLDLDGAGGPYTFTPTLVTGLTNVAHLAGGAGGRHSCAVTWDNRVFCWGHDANGELGVTLDGGATGTSTPQEVLGL